MELVKRIQIFLFLIAIFSFYNCPDNKLSNDNHDQEEIHWPSLANSPWPMHMHDPQHTGRSPYSGPSEGVVEWSIELPTFETFANPIIDEIGNIIVAAVHFTGYVKVFSFTQEGAFNWEQRFNNSYEGSSAVATSDSLLYLNIGTDLTQMDVYGNVNWQYPFKRAEIYESRLTPNISMDGKHIYVSGYDSALYAINSDGTLYWKYSVASDESYGEATLSPDGETIYFISQACILYAINKNGTEKWQVQLSKETSRGNIVSPIVDNQGRIYLYSYQTLYCINPDGVIEWENQELDYFGRGYNGCSIGSDGTINVSMFWSYYAFDYSGNVKWGKVELDAGIHIANIPTVDIEGYVYLGKELGGSDDWDQTSFFSYDINGETRYYLVLVERTNIGSPACIDNSGHAIFGSDSYIPQLIKLR